MSQREEIDEMVRAEEREAIAELDPLDAIETRENRMDDVTPLLSLNQRIWLEITQANEGAYCSWFPRWAWNLYKKRIPNFDCIESLKYCDRLHRILNHIASHGIHTKNVDAQITMSMEDQREDLVTVLEREMKRGNING